MENLQQSSNVNKIKNIIFVYPEEIDGQYASYVFQLSIQLQLIQSQTQLTLHEALTKMPLTRIFLKAGQSQRKTLKLHQKWVDQKTILKDQVTKKVLELDILPYSFTIFTYFVNMQHSNEKQKLQELLQIINPESIIFFLGICLSSPDQLADLGKKVAKIFVIDYNPSSAKVLQQIFQQEKDKQANEKLTKTINCIINYEQCVSMISKDFCDKIFNFSKLYTQYFNSKLDLKKKLKYFENTLRYIEDYQLNENRFYSSIECRQVIQGLVSLLNKRVFNGKDKQRYMVQVFYSLAPSRAVLLGKKVIKLNFIFNIQLLAINRMKVILNYKNEKKEAKTVNCVAVFSSDKVSRNYLANLLLQKQAIKDYTYHAVLLIRLKQQSEGGENEEEQKRQDDILRISMRTTKNSEDNNAINCESLAKYFGGGGSQFSSGFELTKEQLIQNMDSNDEQKKFNKYLKQMILQEKQPNKDEDEDQNSEEQNQTKKMMEKISKDYVHQWQVCEQNLDRHEQNVCEILIKLGKGSYVDSIKQDMCGEDLYRECIMEQPFYKDLKPIFYQYKKDNRQFIDFNDLNAFYEKKGENIKKQKDDLFQKNIHSTNFNIFVNKSLYNKLVNKELTIGKEEIDSLVKYTKHNQIFSQELVKSLYAKILLKVDHREFKKNLLHNKNKYFVNQDKKNDLQSNKNQVSNQIKKKLAVDKILFDIEQFKLNKNYSDIAELKILQFMDKEMDLSIKGDKTTQTFFEKIIFLEKMLLKFQNIQGQSIINKSKSIKLSISFLKDIYSYYCFLRERIKFSYNQLLIKFPKLIFNTKYDKIVIHGKVEPYPTQIRMTNLIKQQLDQVEKNSNYGALIFYKSMIGSGKTSLTIAIASLILNIRERMDKEDNDFIKTKPLQIIYATYNTSVQLQVARAAFNMKIPFALLRSFYDKTIVLKQNQYKSWQFPILLVSDLSTAKKHLKLFGNDNFVIFVDECVMDADEQESPIVKETVEILNYTSNITILASATLPDEKQLTELKNMWQKNFDKHFIHVESSKEFQTGLEIRDFNQRLFSPLCFCKTVEDLKNLKIALEKNAFLDRLFSANVLSYLLDKVIQTADLPQFKNLNLKKFSLDDLKDVNQVNIQKLANQVIDNLIELKNDELVRVIAYENFEEEQLFNPEDEKIFNRNAFTSNSQLFTDGALIVQNDTTQFLRDYLLTEYMLEHFSVQQQDQMDEKQIMKLKRDKILAYYHKLKNFNNYLIAYNADQQRQFDKIEEERKDPRQMQVLKDEWVEQNPRREIELEMIEKALTINSKEHFWKYRDKSVKDDQYIPKKFLSNEEFLFFYQKIKEQYTELTSDEKLTQRKRKFNYQRKEDDDFLNILPYIGVGMYSYDYNDQFISQIMKIQYENRLSFLVADDSISYGINTKISTIIIDNEMIKDKSFNTIIQLMGRASRVGQSWKGVIFCGYQAFKKIKEQIFINDKFIPIEAIKLEKYAAEIIKQLQNEEDEENNKNEEN